MSDLRPAVDDVTAALATVNDPEIGRPITDLGMVKSVDVREDGGVDVAVYLTVAGCPMRDEITGRVQQAVGKLAGVTGVQVTLDVMSDQQRSELHTKVLDAVFSTPPFDAVLREADSDEDALRILAESATMHASIAAAVVAGDSEAAGTAARAHLDDVERRIIRKRR